MPEKKKHIRYDPKRGLAFAAFGGIYTGFFQHFWFSFLSEHIAGWGEALKLWGPPHSDAQWWRWFDLPARLAHTWHGLLDGPPLAPVLPPPSPLMLATAKLCVNQLLAIPLANMPLFFAITGALGGLTPTQSIARARSLYAPLLRRNYAFWFPVQFVQFMYLPTAWQVPYVCVASLCWTVLLSRIGGSTAPPVAASLVVAYETEPATTTASSNANASNEGGTAVLDSNVVEEVEEVVRVVAVPEDPVNALMDSVLFVDLRQALIDGPLLSRSAPSANSNSTGESIEAQGSEIEELEDISEEQDDSLPRREAEKKEVGT